MERSMYAVMAVIGFVIGFAAQWWNLKTVGSVGEANTISFVIVVVFAVIVGISTRKIGVGFAFFVPGLIACASVAPRVFELTQH